MKIEKWNHNQEVVKSGRVETSQKIFLADDCGCGLPNCHCSDGYFVSINFGKNEYGEVNGVTVFFDGKKEYNDFLNGNHIY